jgi:hypothetical protein
MSITIAIANTIAMSITMENSKKENFNQLIK